MRTHALPLLVCVAAAAMALSMLLTGEQRSIRIDLSLWGLPLGAAGIFAACWYLAVWLRHRRLRALEETRAATQAEARTAHRTFISRLDHELKNPVTALRMAVVSVPDPGLAAAMAGQVERLGSLVAELRKISEIEEYPIANEPVHLKEVVDEALEAAMVRDRQVSVVFPRAPRPLPPVRGDRDLVFLALYNIITNAKKYSSPGATLEIRGIEERDGVVVEVSDTGRGIPQTDVEHVWGELARGSDVRHIPGNGLGLPMVAAVLRRLGGACDLSSIEGRGTTVRMRLPRYYD
ncbi:MAG: HAMP domain-containing sensor histidine kinase [Propionibacteriaceae bacterium]|nr:HAMP domain-containing sensor histidine kinase [Propionibacteriaceae bacterium]